MSHRHNFLLAACGVASITSAQQPSVATDDEVRALLARRVDIQKKATGIVLGLTTPAGRRIVSYGVLAKGDPRSLDGRTVFEIASLTKIFTALLLADLAARKEVGLHDPVSRYLPAGPREITLFHLASHTSGLPLRPPNLGSQTALDKYAGYTVAQLYEALGDFELDGEPGRRFQYSNFGYAVLGHALATKSGLSYEELVRRRITEPLLMRDTRIPMTSDMKRRLAVGHSEELIPGFYEGTGALAPAGDLHSTTGDLLNLLEAFMDRRPTGLRPAMDLMLKRTVPADDPRTVIGLGWRITTRDGHRIIWSGGRADGFRSFMGYSQATGIGAVGLANAASAMGVDDIAQHLIDPTFPVNLKGPGDYQQVRLSHEALDRFVGRYRFEDETFITFTRHGDHLVGEMTGQGSFDAYPESENSLFLTIVDAQFRFERAGDADKAHAVTLHQDGMTFRATRVPSPER